MGGKSPKNFKEILKNEREEFLKIGGKFSKKFVGKIKDKPQAIFSFQLGHESMIPSHYFRGLKATT